MTRLEVIAAWWGALTGTLALAWKIFTDMRRGPRLRVAARAHVAVISGLGVHGEDLVMVEVRNIGDAPTTLLSIAGRHWYTRRQKVLCRRASWYFAVPAPGYGEPLPHELGPGQRWTGALSVAAVRKHIGSGGLLELGVEHSMGRHRLTTVANWGPE